MASLTVTVLRGAPTVWGTAVNCKVYTPHSQEAFLVKAQQC